MNISLALQARRIYGVEAFRPLFLLQQHYFNVYPSHKAALMYLLSLWYVLHRGVYTF